MVISKNSILIKVLIIFIIIGLGGLFLTHGLITKRISKDRFILLSEKYKTELNNINFLMDENTRKLSEDLSGILKCGFIYEEAAIRNNDEILLIISNILNDYCISHKNIDNIYIRFVDGTIITNDNNTQNRFFPEDIISYANTGLPYKIDVTAPYNNYDTDTYFLTAYMAIPDKNDDIIGVIGVETNITNYLNFFKRLELERSGILGILKSGVFYTVILNEKDELVFMPDEDLYKVRSEIFDDAATTTYFDKSYFIFKSVSELTGLSLFFLLPEETFLNDINHITSMAVRMLSIIITTICLFGTLGILITVISPIRKLTAAIWPSSLDLSQKITLPPAGNDEIGDLNRTFSILLSELFEHKEHLMELVDDKTVELKQAVTAAEKARSEAEIAEKVKGEFLANISHEIRTPMNAIIGLSYLIKNTELSDNQLDYILKIENASKSLMSLINDIMDFSKIEKGKIEIAQNEFSLDDILENIARIFSPQVYDKGLDINFKISPDIPESLTGDGFRLGQILLNLISNAVKFTEKGEIIVTCDVKDLTDDDITLEFSISDTGIGMTEEQTAQLFQSFSQADASSTRKYGGAGLGLALAGHLAELLQGNIEVKSIPGEGSVFTLYTRFKLTEKRSTAADLMKSTGIENKTILAASSSSTVTGIISDCFKIFDINVETVQTENALLENIRQLSPDIIFYDSDFKLDEYHSTSSIPIVSCSSNHEAGSVFLEKPFLPSALFKLTASLLGGEFPAINESVVDIPFGGYSGKKILLVEDNKINQQVATELLKKHGFEVSIENNGKEALNFFYNNKDNTPDLVLMDIQMPEMDGYTAAGELRSSGYTMPIIALSANVMPEDQQKAFLSGMNDFVSKPVNPEELYSKLRKYLGSPLSTDEDVQPVFEEESVQSDTAFELNGFDTETAIYRIGGDTDFYIELLGDFYKEFSNALEDYQVLIKEDDLEPARRLIHTIKGVSGNLGAMDLHYSAADLESCIKTGDLISAEKKYNLFKDNLILTFDNILKSGIINSGEKVLTGEKTADISLLPELLKEFILHSSGRKPVQAGDSIKNILQYHWPEEYLNTLKEIFNLVKKYKLKEAAKKAEEILDILGV